MSLACHCGCASHYSCGTAAALDGHVGVCGLGLPTITWSWAITTLPPRLGSWSLDRGQGGSHCLATVLDFGQTLRPGLTHYRPVYHAILWRCLHWYASMNYKICTHYMKFGFVIGRPYLCIFIFNFSLCKFYSNGFKSKYVWHIYYIYHIYIQVFYNYHKII